MEQESPEAAAAQVVNHVYLFSLLVFAEPATTMTAPDHVGHVALTLGPVRERTVRIPTGAVVVVTAATPTAVDGPIEGRVKHREASVVRTCGLALCAGFRARTHDAKNGPFEVNDTVDFKHGRPNTELSILDTNFRTVGQ